MCDIYFRTHIVFICDIHSLTYLVGSNRWSVILGPNMIPSNWCHFTRLQRASSANVAAVGGIWNW